MVNGDCCNDACTLCGECPNYSCDGICDTLETTGGCSCASDCWDVGDCCPDVADACGYLPAEAYSCEGQCGGITVGGCWCDPTCVAGGDCCEDACDVCGACEIPEDPLSCEGHCGDFALSGCSCQADCWDSGSCCGDVTAMCGFVEPPPGDSCENQCGGQAPDGCWCDDSCAIVGDCCEDACDQCGACPDPDSCDGICGDQAPGGCWCDSSCIATGDCCADACSSCGECGSCDAADACTPGEQEVTDCGYCGFSVRTCDDSCNFTEWGACVDDGVCQPGEQIVGLCDGACSITTCLNGCGWGECKTIYDDNEPNDSLSDATFLGSFVEGDEIPSQSGFTHQPFPAEQDWFLLETFENEALFDWSMNFRVTLTTPPGANMAVCVTYDVYIGDISDGTWCVEGTGVLIVDTGNVEVVDPFIDDDGTLAIVVEGDASCTDYSLDIVFD